MVADIEPVQEVLEVLCQKCYASFDAVRGDTTVIYKSLRKAGLDDRKGIDEAWNSSIKLQIATSGVTNSQVSQAKRLLKLHQYIKVRVLRSVTITYQGIRGGEKKKLIRPDVNRLDIGNDGYDSRISQIDLDFVSRTPYLERLKLRGTLTSLDLTPLSQCTKLLSLHLVKHALSKIDFGPLAKCSFLQQVTIRKNKLTSIDISPLATCSNLLSLALDGNPLKELDIGPLDHIVGLKISVSTETIVKHSTSYVEGIEKSGERTFKTFTIPVKRKKKTKKIVTKPEKKVPAEKKPMERITLRKKVSLKVDKWVDAYPGPTIRRFSRVFFLENEFKIKDASHKRRLEASFVKLQKSNHEIMVVGHNDLVYLYAREKAQPTPSPLRPREKKRALLPERRMTEKKTKKKKAKKQPAKTQPEEQQPSPSKQSLPSALRIWWDYENMGIKFEQLGEFVRDLESHGEIKYALAAAQWSRYHKENQQVGVGHERVLRELGFKVVASESEEKDAADNDIQVSMEQAETRDGLVEVMITHDGGFSKYMNKMREKGATIWLISKKNPPEELLKSADWYSTMDDIDGIKRLDSARENLPLRPTTRIISELIPEKKPVVKRGYDVIGKRLEYKVKIENNTDEFMINVSVAIISYPRECLEIQGPIFRDIRNIEPGDLRSPKFTFIPTQDCVRGQVRATVTYFDFRNQPHHIDVKPQPILSICDMLQPLEKTAVEFGEIIKDMEQNRTQLKYDYNPQVLYRSFISILKLNFDVIDPQETTGGGQFVGDIQALAIGKNYKKKAALQISVMGAEEGCESIVTINARGDDAANLPSMIEDIERKIDEFGELVLDSMGTLSKDITSILQLAGESGDVIESINKHIEALEAKDDVGATITKQLFHLAGTKITEIGVGQKRLEDAVIELIQRMEAIAENLGLDRSISEKLKDAAKGATKEAVKAGIGSAVLFALRSGLNLLGFPIP